MQLGEQMIVESITAIPLAVPVKRVGYFTRARRTEAQRTIVEVRFSNGLTGIGESRGIDAARIIAERFAEPLLGQPVTDPAALRRRCLPDRADCGYPDQLTDQIAYSALDTAFLGGIGKQAGLPLDALLGGRCRDVVRFVAYEYTVDPAEGVAAAELPERMADKLAAAVEDTGKDFVEFKVGVYPVDADIESIAAVRDRLRPGIAIGVDANMGWDFDTAERFIAATQAQGLANIEEPVAELAGMERLATRHGVNVSSHAIVPELLRSFPAIDGAVGESHAEGALIRTRDLSERLAALGKRYWFRSVWETGVSWAAMCHMAVAFPSLTRPMQVLFNLLSDDLIVETNFAMKGGAVPVPDRPGMGVTLDLQAVEAYRLDGPRQAI